MWAAGHWTGAYFNLPGFLIVFVLTLLLVRGVRESAEANNVMVADQDRRHPHFPGRRRHAGQSSQLDTRSRPPASPASLPAAPSCSSPTSASIRFRPRPKNARTPQRDLPFGIIASLIVCTVLYVGVAIVLLGMMKYTTFVSGEAAEAPVAYALK